MQPTNNPSPANKQTELAEFQGLYGSYHVAEILLQKIWLRREFTVDDAKTHDGLPFKLYHPGNWNRLSGPDFLGARMRIGDREITGDVEIHFRSESWIQHGHDRDPAFDNVVLHVVLFPPNAYAAPTLTSSEKGVPVLVLFDLLWHDLEEYATDDALAALNDRDPWPALERLLALQADERQAVLESAAERRWREKCHFASLRVRRLGWAEACHQTALEILGYRANRVAMLKTAREFTFADWSTARPEQDALLDAGGDDWSTRGVRPANHPKTRLEQYSRWMEAVPDWPKLLLHQELPQTENESAADDIGRTRRALQMSKLREQLAANLCGDTLSGTRLDTWIVNLVLPFLASTDQADRARILWLAWYPGDAPDAHREAARQLLDQRRQPMSNGLLQAIVDLQLERWRADGAAVEFEIEPRDG